MADPDMRLLATRASKEANNWAALRGVVGDADGIDRLADQIVAQYEHAPALGQLVSSELRLRAAFLRALIPVRGS